MNTRSGFKPAFRSASSTIANVATITRSPSCARRAARGRAVQRDHPAAALALDRIDRKALAVVDVPDVDPLGFDDVGGVEQVCRPRSRP
jgi:hypothetical protein